MNDGQTMKVLATVGLVTMGMLVACKVLGLGPVPAIVVLMVLAVWGFAKIS